jgi:site-specific DNA recombinase
VIDATTNRTETVVARGTERPSYQARAVCYLRVSTEGQAKTDREGEGYSLSAQRDACIKKAVTLGADVIDIYVDAGESARQSDRPQLQEMLERLKNERDVDFVIVHKIDRLARNRGDDVNITLAIREAGAQLVSVSENIDETPSGMLLHGIMSSIAEFYSRNLATEVIKGTRKKVEGGTYPGRAPIGYVNRQDPASNNKYRWIETDADRAPLVTWAFEAYATEEYSIRQLAESLGEQGLKTRPTPSRPGAALDYKAVYKLLHNRFYLGVFKWQGIEHPGNHEPLVSPETFARVQAVIASRRSAGDRPQKYRHYLKGTIFCARCGARMMYSRNKGRHGGVFDYFVCMGRHTHKNGCELPYVPVDGVEVAVEAYYGTLVLGKKTVTGINSKLLSAAKKKNASGERRVRRDRKRILDLEQERRKLLQAHLAGAVPVDLLKEEQDRITAELANAGASLANIEVHWETFQKSLKAALSLATRFGEAYRLAEPSVRRWFNQAVFEGVYVDVEGEIARAELANPFKLFYEENVVDNLEMDLRNATTAEVEGSNLGLLVGAEGLEPPACWL